MDGPARSRLASRTAFCKREPSLLFTKAFRGVSAPNREPTNHEFSVIKTLIASTGGCDWLPSERQSARDCEGSCETSDIEE
jgi:hypothetical protein